MKPSPPPRLSVPLNGLRSTPTPSGARVPRSAPSGLRIPSPGRGAARALGLSLLSGVAVQAVAVQAADFDDQRNRFYVGGRAALNVQVEFRNTAAPLVGQFGPPAGGATDRSYFDGFVRVDSSGNAAGETWNWGYDKSSQVLPGDTAIVHHGYSGNPWGDTADGNEDPQWGGELGYTRVLSEWAGGRWGLELGFNFLSLDLGDDSARAGSVTETSDTYALNGVIPPTAPFAGSFVGPGAVLSDNPTRTTAAVPTRISGNRELTGELYGFKLGPMLDIPLGDWLSAQVSGGLAVALFDGEFSFTERAEVVGGPAWSATGSASGSEWLLGGYVRGQLTGRLSDHVGVYAAAEFQALESVQLDAVGRSAELDLSSSALFSLGLNFRF